MTIEEYFGDWTKVIDRVELDYVMSKLSTEYKRKFICPDQANVFKAFNLCPFKDLKIVMVGQDFNYLL